ncbi:MAG: hypothetical protein CL790_02655 [Chloroflexi bacterium]|nr:hypothetical protein [Chloroflexota bacterium]
MKSSLIRTVRVANTRIVAAMTLVFVLGFAQIACGSNGEPKRQDLSAIDPKRCGGYSNTGNLC